MEGTPSRSVTGIEEEPILPPTSVPPEGQVVKKTKRVPEYNQPWAKWYRFPDENGNMTTSNVRKMVGEIKNQFTKIKDELRAIFAYQQNKVSITSDIWTAGKHGLGYSCVTGHWIDDQWVLQKRILSFRVLDSPHSAHVIFKSIIEVLEEYNLKRDRDNKVFSISFDNASNNVASIEIFKRSLNPIMNGAMFHQKCACHILNLVVKAGLKTEAVKDLIIKLKDCLSHIVSNQERKQRFGLMCVNYGLSKLKVPWDIDTRWNSTYRFLNRCLPYKAVIGEFLRGSTPEGMALEPSLEEWEQLQP
ncbi:hypothetical protein FCM35_KLT22436 [Carex littledalei]|uniref:Uncharacterized protein n=1 Tax=Carex littledalei TaxID=544730 RepID=A0A833QGB5_9POAL|nr:hypothetical protein FCM35_KLT22436 [Carex littledalei]